MEPNLFLVGGLVVTTFALAVALLVSIRTRRKTEPKPLPEEWDLTARPVFSTDERRIYRQLREALPHHIVLSKLPLLRFCQPLDPSEVRYWYDLLGSINVTFAVCSPNGRVLAAVDLDNDRSNSRRVLQIKQSVLGACRVRYMRCPVDHIPSVPELQLLVPHTTAASYGPQPAQGLREVRPGDAPPVPAQRAALWQDSGFFQDSFFGVDARDAAVPSGGSGFETTSMIQPDIDLSGNVLEPPRFGTTGSSRTVRH